MTASNDGIACCRAQTAECLACAENTTISEYCKENPDTSGCKNDNEKFFTFLGVIMIIIVILGLLSIILRYYFYDYNSLKTLLFNFGEPEYNLKTAFDIVK
jgi:hypothetical protein